MNNNRLTTCLKKKSWRKDKFDLYEKGVEIIPYPNDIGFETFSGYKDFPSPENIG